VLQEVSTLSKQNCARHGFRQGKNGHQDCRKGNGRESNKRTYNRDLATMRGNAAEQATESSGRIVLGFKGKGETTFRTQPAFQIFSYTRAGGKTGGKVRISSGGTKQLVRHQGKKARGTPK